VSRKAFRKAIKKLFSGLIKLLPDNIKRALFLFSFKTTSEGSKDLLISQFDGIPNMGASLRNIKRQGFEASAIIDCGAFEGNWTRLIKGVFPGAKILMIEANPGKEAYLRKAKIEYPETVDYVIALLGAESGRLMQFCNMETGSSVFEEQSNVPRTFLTLTTKTLDEIVKEKKINDATFIKLDVQGSEIEVLKGAKEVLKKAEFVLLEVSLLEYNKGAPLFDKVVQFMADQGFVLYDICHLQRWPQSGVLLQADVIFTRKESKQRPVLFNSSL